MSKRKRGSGAPPLNDAGPCPRCNGTGRQLTAFAQRDVLRIALEGWMWEKGRVAEFIAWLEPDDILVNAYLQTVVVRKPDGTERIFSRYQKAGVGDAGVHSL